LDVVLYKNPDFEGFDGREGSGVMLGWIVLLMSTTGMHCINIKAMVLSPFKLSAVVVRTSVDLMVGF
jgi:hypothetical protein